MAKFWVQEDGTMKVKDVMQRSVATVAEDESLALALQLMLWNDVRHLPVLRPADGRATGIISERDILPAHQRHRDENVMLRPARDFMVKPPEHIDPNAPLADAAADLAPRSSAACLCSMRASSWAW
jgi:CBS domain-containing protein